MRSTWDRDLEYPGNDCECRLARDTAVDRPQVDRSSKSPPSGWQTPCRPRIEATFSRERAEVSAKVVPSDLRKGRECQPFRLLINQKFQRRRLVIDDHDNSHRP